MTLSLEASAPCCEANQERIRRLALVSARVEMLWCSIMRVEGGDVGI